jgi:hypothetical protein
MAQKGEIKLAYMLRRGGPERIVFVHGLGPLTIGGTAWEMLLKAIQGKE